MDTPQIDAGKALGWGWASVKKDLWYFVGITFIVMVVGSIGSEVKGSNMWDFIGLLLSALMTCGYTTIALNFHQSGAKLPVSALFTNTKQYLPVLGATILLGLLIGIGFFFLIIPGIYLALTYQFTMALIIDKHLGVMDAMKQSAALTKGKKMALFQFDLMSFGVMLLGVLALGVGVLVAAPVVMLANIDVYRKLVPAQVAPSAPVAK